MKKSRVTSDQADLVKAYDAGQRAGRAMQKGVRHINAYVTADLRKAWSAGFSAGVVEIQEAAEQYLKESGF